MLFDALFVDKIVVFGAFPRAENRAFWCSSCQKPWSRSCFLVLSFVPKIVLFGALLRARNRAFWCFPSCQKLCSRSCFLVLSFVPKIVLWIVLAVTAIRLVLKQRYLQCCILMITSWKPNDDAFSSLSIVTTLLHLLFIVATLPYFIRSTCMTLQEILWAVFWRWDSSMVNPPPVNVHLDKQNEVKLRLIWWCPDLKRKPFRKFGWNKLPFFSIHIVYI